MASSSVNSMKKFFRYSTLFIAINSGLWVSNVYADNYFNPAFLSDDTSAVADLSVFENEKRQLPGSYHVDIYLNDKFIRSGPLNFAASDDAPSGLQACLSSEFLVSLGISTVTGSDSDKNKNDCVNLGTIIPDSSSSFDFAKQKLSLSIPQAALSSQARGYIPPSQWDNGITALLINYAFNGSNNSGSNSANSSSYYLSLNNGVNLGAWRFRDRSSWSYQKNKNGAVSDKWQHISTYAERAIEKIQSQFVVGDSFTPSDVFDSLSFRGVQVMTDESMLPDSQKGFAPTIHGIAKTNAQVTVRQNGYIIYQTYVSPGAFIINDLYPTSSGGDLDVTVKENDGRTETYKVAYSAVPVLQREGQLKYAATVAEFRGNKSNQTASVFGQLTSAFGISNGFTLYGGTQLAKNYQSVAIGIGKNLNQFGAFSVDITHARSHLADDSDHQGQSLRFLYAKSLSDYGTNFQLLGYRYSTSGFYTLEDTTHKIMDGYSDEDNNGQRYFNLRQNKRSRIQANISQQLGEYGSIFLSGSLEDYWGTAEKNRLLQVGFNSTYHDMNYNISYNYNKNSHSAQADQGIALSVSIPLSEWLSSERSNNTAYASYNINTNNRHNIVQTAGINGTLLEQNNFGYSVQQGYTNQGVGASGNITANYQGSVANSNVGYNYSDGSRQLNYGLAGGIILHENGVTFSQPLGDTNILIAAPDAGDVLIENSAGVRTDWRGYAILPYANNYRQNRVALDPNTLATNVELQDSVLNVVPTKGAIVRTHFTTKVGSRVLLTLSYRQSLIPFGAIVTVYEESANTGIVGDSGQVYLSGLSADGKLLVKWGNATTQQCTVDYQLPAGSENKIITRLKSECR